MTRSTTGRAAALLLTAGLLTGCSDSVLEGEGSHLGVEGIRAALVTTDDVPEGWVSEAGDVLEDTMPEEYCPGTGVDLEGKKVTFGQAIVSAGGDEAMFVLVWEMENMQDAAELYSGGATGAACVFTALGLEAPQVDGEEWDVPGTNQAERGTATNPHAPGELDIFAGVAQVGPAVVQVASLGAADEAAEVLEAQVQKYRGAAK